MAKRVRQPSCAVTLALTMAAVIVGVTGVAGVIGVAGVQNCGH